MIEIPGKNKNGVKGFNPVPEVGSDPSRLIQIPNKDIVRAPHFANIHAGRNITKTPGRFGGYDINAEDSGSKKTFKEYNITKECLNEDTFTMDFRELKGDIYVYLFASCEGGEDLPYIYLDLLLPKEDSKVIHFSLYSDIQTPFLYGYSTTLFVIRRIFIGEYPYWYNELVETGIDLSCISSDLHFIYPLAGESVHFSFDLNVLRPYQELPDEEGSEGAIRTAHISGFGLHSEPDYENLSFICTEQRKELDLTFKIADDFIPFFLSETVTRKIQADYLGSAFLYLREIHPLIDSFPVSIAEMQISEDSKLNISEADIYDLHKDAVFSFAGCANLQYVTLNPVIETIWDGAFKSTGLTEFQVGTNVESIGEYAFCDTPINSLQFSGTSLKYINQYAFYRTELSTLSFLAQPLDVISDYAFAECEKLWSVLLPDSLTSIGTCAFAKTALKTIEIPSSVTYIGNDAFADDMDYVRLKPVNPPSISANPFGQDNDYTVYVGKGDDKEEDDGIKETYINAEGWKEFNSRIDTWYNHLHPSL